MYSSRTSVTACSLAPAAPRETPFVVLSTVFRDDTCTSIGAHDPASQRLVLEVAHLRAPTCDDPSGPASVYDCTVRGAGPVSHTSALTPRRRSQLDGVVFKTDCVTQQTLEGAGSLVHRNPICDTEWLHPHSVLDGVL